MPNMSYCQFQNTYMSLRECEETLDTNENEDDISKDEKEAKRRLIDLCVDIALSHGDEVDRPVLEETDTDF